MLNTAKFFYYYTYTISVQNFNYNYELNNKLIQRTFKFNFHFIVISFSTILRKLTMESCMMIITSKYTYGTLAFL